MFKKLVITGCVEAILLSVAVMIDPEFMKSNAEWIAVSAMALLVLMALYEWWKGRQ